MRRRFLRLPCLLLVCLALCLTGGTTAQGQGSTSRILQVFAQADGGTTRLLFLDAGTGETEQAQVEGDRFTPLGDRVLFWNTAERRAEEVWPNGRTRASTLLTGIMGDDIRRVDWAVSRDARLLAYTVTRGTVNALTTETRIVPLGDDETGATTPILLQDGPYEGVRAFPVAFSGDAGTLYMDYQPDTIADFTPFRQYASLFALDLSTGEIRSLPGEPGCFCGAGVGETSSGGTLLRLALGSDGFFLRAVDLLLGTTRDLPAPLAGYDLGGDVLIAPDGAHAVYALARVRGFEGAGGTLETQFMLVDLAAFTQRPFFEASTRYLRPVAWTEDGSAVLFTSPGEPGTWKARIGETQLEQVSAATYIGQVRGEGDR